MNYNILANKKIIEKTSENLTLKHIEVAVVENKKEALEKIIEYIPAGASVMNGSSVTLEQIGYIDYLKSNNHSWNNLHKAIVEESDPARQTILRKQSLLSDFYLGSVHAVTEDGQFVIASNTGSQLPHIAFSSSNLIFVISTKKIVPTLDGAMTRLLEHVVPLEDERSIKTYGVGTFPNKVLTWRGENQMMGRKIRVIFVNEDLGF